MDELREIEQNLRRSLQHVAAPEGFTDRVMARVAAREAPVATRPAQAGRLVAVMPSRAGWWTALAAALALAVGGGNVLHMRHLQHQRQAAAMQAQLDLAMQLTNHALNEVGVGIDRSPMGRFAQILNSPPAATQK